MKALWSAFAILLLSGCVSPGNQSAQRLELYYSQEQTTLTARQKDDITALFNTAPAWTLDVAPSSHEQPFRALLISQQRIKAIRQLAKQHSIRLNEQYQPRQSADTVIIREP
ncbi:hypothetical protein VV869_03810 [Photobacterium sp. MCCC 1A19761]|uniref:hypothetical protein n=1 Tax=Photobacterium sp. MCCC 1A19761 TaxID=3115000 RepID=UPI00307ED129